MLVDQRTNAVATCSGLELPPMILDSGASRSCLKGDTWKELCNRTDLHLEAGAQAQWGCSPAGRWKEPFKTARFGCFAVEHPWQACHSRICGC